MVNAEQHFLILKGQWQINVPFEIWHSILDTFLKNKVNKKIQISLIKVGLIFFKEKKSERFYI